MTVRRVLIIRNAFQNDFGGAENYALRLAIELKKVDFVPILVSRVPELLDQAQKNRIKTIKGKWHEAQGWGKIYKIIEPLMIFWYIFIILRYGVDVVHPQGRDDFIFATTAAKLLGKKVVWTDHADLKYILKDSNSTPAVKIHKMAGYVNAVIAVSESEKKEIIKVDPSFTNLTVVHNGVDSIKNDIKPAKRGKNRIVIGSTARLVDTKGIRELLQAFALLKNSKTELWLVGKGQQEEEYRVAAKELGIADRTIFIGHQSNIWPYLKAIDIYVLPTYHEAFSIALLEAGIAGKAVVATNVGGNPEVINKDTGILIPIKDPQQLADALQRYIDNPALRKKKGAALQKLVQKEFNFTDIVKTKIIPLYEK
jgi:glycosyltransferase involved in cell wall biosynthesis